MSDGLWISGGATAAPAVERAARYVRLTAPEWATVAGLAGRGTPAGFDPVAVTDRERDDARSGLARRGLVNHGKLIEPLEWGLAVLAAPGVAVTVEIAAGGGGLRAVTGWSDPVGAGALTLPDGAVEVSLFNGAEWPFQLARVVPQVADLVPGLQVWAALDTLPRTVRQRSLPLAALTEYLPARAVLEPADLAAAGDRLGLSAEHRRTAEQLDADTVATLRAAVTGALPDGSVGVDQVVWFGTRDGWVGVRPDPMLPGERMVDLVPVEPGDLPSWLAGTIATLLEARDG